ncbi:hypothetical protein EGM51_04505 [Verrucomicrobia bacterium S94]|nr:hypothetical protein EGM51_04505 [Verrucomicrobia bacterium S94]
MKAVLLFLRPEPEALFNENAAAFAAGTIGTHGGNLGYHGIIRDGIGEGSLRTHYQNSVVNAFATAPRVADYIQSLSSTETIVLAHSLGNMVVSSAICEYNAPVRQYYALNAAVALEAYGDVTSNEALIPDVFFCWEREGFLDYERRGWRDYPHETWASEWYRLFPENDPRAELTWRHKFADIQKKTAVFNFYSSTEDVLRVLDDVNSIIKLIDWSSVRPELRFHVFPLTFTSDKKCAWQLQEMYKGLNDWVATYFGGGSSKQAGWGFTKEDGMHVKTVRKKTPGSHPPSYSYRKYTETPAAATNALSTLPGNETRRADYLEKLKTDPLFRKEPAILFDENHAADFVSGTVSDYAGHLDYTNDDTELDISNVIVRDWLLAKAFPSRTGPMGSAENKEWDALIGNYDMSALYMTDPDSWFDDDKYLERATWHHSDWKNAPYVHVYKLFDKITTKEN